MQKKILSDQTLEELKYTEKKYSSTVKLYTVLFCILIGIAVYLTIKNDFSIYNIFPLIFMPVYIYTLINLKKVKDEIKVRTSYIFMLKKMKEEQISQS